MPDKLDQPINLNFRITEGERRAFKEWCARGGMTQTAAFRDSFALLKLVADQFGALEAPVMTQVLRGIRSIVIDKELDLTVEKRGFDAWSACLSGSVLTRDLERQYEAMPSSRTKEFIAATRFSFAEAMRIASDYHQKNTKL